TMGSAISFSTRAAEMARPTTIERTVWRALRRSLAASWLGVLHTVALERRAQVGERARKVAIEVKDRGKPQYACDVLCGPLVLELEGQQQSFTRRQVGERFVNCGRQIGAAHRRIGCRLRALDLIGIQLGGDQLLEIASHGVLVALCLVVAAR